MSNDYDVGFKKPPNHTKFQKGQSGNPNGRPKGSRNMSTIMQEVLGRPVIIRQNGQERRIPLREAFVHRLAGKTLEGNVRDMIALMKAIHDYFPEVLKPEKPQKTLTIQFVSPDGQLTETLPELRERRATQGQGAPTETNPHHRKHETDDALEAAWRASGIDNGPDEP